MTVSVPVKVRSINRNTITLKMGTKSCKTLRRERNVRSAKIEHKIDWNSWWCFRNSFEKQKNPRYQRNRHFTGNYQHTNTSKHKMCRIV